MVTVFLSANVMADGKSKTVSKGKGKGKVANGITPGAAINADKSNTAITSSNTSLKTKQSSVLIITNVVKVIFENDKSKAEFEALFRRLDPGVEFHYLSGLRRVRVGFQTVAKATAAQEQLNNNKTNMGLACHFLPPVNLHNQSPASLQPPVPNRTYLLSPPASPPVGWEPAAEREPIINYDLLAALANIAPGQAHELQPGSGSRPSIVVHVCEDPEGYIGSKAHITQTKCPDRKT